MRFIKFEDSIIPSQRIESIEYLGDCDGEYAIGLCIGNEEKMIIERFPYYEGHCKLTVEHEALGRMDELLAQLNK